jgi:NAD(P)-dependent dehydrogenase (short-subunit alcohol dehydrogenase family)
MKIDDHIVAVVSGAASGLGEATARALAAAGAKVAIFDRDAAKGQTVAASIGGVFCEVDVTSQQSVEAAFARARAAHGQERILVNCAGIAPAQKTVSRNRDDGTFRSHSLDNFDSVIQINLVGTYRCIATSAAGMAALDPIGEEGERGVIINTASIAALEGQVGQAAYSASKGGVLALTLPVARDLMDYGIRVNAILPGMMWTPMLEGMPANVTDALQAGIPFPKRFGKPQEFAQLALSIIANSYLNGEHIRLDGAARMAAK